MRLNVLPPALIVLTLFGCGGGHDQPVENPLRFDGLYFAESGGDAGCFRFFADEKLVFTCHPDVHIDCSDLEAGQLFQILGITKTGSLPTTGPEVYDGRGTYKVTEKSIHLSYRVLKEFEREGTVDEDGNLRIDAQVFRFRQVSHPWR